MPEAVAGISSFRYMHPELRLTHSTGHDQGLTTSKTSIDLSMCWCCGMHVQTISGTVQDSEHIRNCFGFDIPILSVASDLSLSLSAVCTCLS